jgi:hypothetical protein
MGPAFAAMLLARGLVWVSYPGKTLTYALRELGHESHGGSNGNLRFCYTTPEGAADAAVLATVPVMLTMPRQKLVRILARDYELRVQLRTAFALDAPPEVLRDILNQESQPQ